MALHPFMYSKAKSTHEGSKEGQVVVDMGWEPEGRDDEVGFIKTHYVQF